MSRRHRWIRGDWQLAGWLLSRVPGPGPRRLPNPLSVLSQWKLLDNLRRSLVPPALTLLLLLGWTVLPHAWLWTLVVHRGPRSSLGVRRPPAMADEARRSAAGAAPRGDRERRRPQRGANRARRSPFFPTRRASTSTRSRARCWRMLVTRRRLLEWNPSAMEDPDRRSGGDARQRAGPAHRSRRCGSRRSSPRRRRSCSRRQARSRSWLPRRSSSCGSSRRASPGG